MKKTKILIIGILVMLMLSVLAIPVLAENDKATPTVMHADDLNVDFCNLDFANDVHIVYAVKSDDPNLKLLIWTEPQTDYVLGTQTATLSPLPDKTTIKGEEYTLFIYDGIVAKQMTDVVYVRACIDGGDTVTYGNAHKYSILQYACNKLGITGTASTNAKLITALEKMLEYGAAMQEYFGYRTDNLATDDFTQIKLTAGTLSDGFAQGLYKVGTQVILTTPKVNAAGDLFSHWEDRQGTSVALSATAAVTVGSVNETYTPVYVACSHNEEIDAYIAPTCTTAGKTEGKRCSVCGKVLVEQIDIPATGHTEEIDAYIAPTCTTAGKTEGKHCGVCGEVLAEQIDIPVIDHTEEIDAYVAPTCTTAGKTEGKHCGACGEVLAEQIDIPATGHDEATDVGVAPTCTEQGKTDGKHCTVCREVLAEQIDIPAAGHHYVNRVCSVCSVREPALTSGSCGENLTWYLYANALDSTKYDLVIIGSGEMNSYTSYQSSPWSAYWGDIVAVSLPTGLTSIGARAFYDFAGLTSIFIPNSVTSIGIDAFHNCSALTSVTFEENSRLTTIGDYAFISCNVLTDMIIPNSVISIGCDAFAGCNSLIQVEGGVSYVDTWVIDCAENLSEVTLRTDTEGIAYEAFSNCNNLTSLLLPSGVRSIGYRAFAYCSNLISIAIPDKVVRIEEYAFFNCQKLTSVTFGENSQLKTISSHAFNYCYELTDFDIPDGVTSIGSAAFSYCSSLTEMVVPDSVTSIGSNAFSGCDALISMTLPFVGESADSTENAYIGYLFSGLSWSNATIGVPETLKTVVITGGESLGEYAFSHCSGLTSITLPEGLKTIGNEAFTGCGGLTGIHIPASVESIGTNAFCYCSSMTSVTFGAGGRLTTIGEWAFSYCSGLTSIEIPVGVTSIGDYAFFGCSQLARATISATVTGIGCYVFNDCSSLTSVTFADTTTWYRTTSLTNWQNKTGGDTISVLNVAYNATYFTDSKYGDYYWYKK